MLRVDSFGQKIGADRKAGILYGCVCAEAIDFKSGRGRFTTASLGKAVLLMRAMPNGLQCRFRHPNGLDDALGSHIGRFKNPRRDGTMLRADLWFDPTSFSTPVYGGRAFADYLFELANGDPAAFGFSLVLTATKTTETDHRGRPVRDAAGSERPPIWMPVAISQCDCVGEGDATHSSLGPLPRVETDADLRARNTARKLQHAKSDAEWLADHPDAELLYMRNRNRKRKLQMGLY